VIPFVEVVGSGLIVPPKQTFGTALKTGANIPIGILGGGVNTSNTAAVWATNTSFGAGVLGFSANGQSGGIGGAVLIEW
jgi:hypothetical protein